MAEERLQSFSNLSKIGQLERDEAGIPIHVNHPKPF